MKGTYVPVHICLCFTLKNNTISPESVTFHAPRTMPLGILLPKIDDLYKSVCLHCHFGELWQQQVLLSIQTLAAFLFTIGYRTRLFAIISFYMYTSLILRNTWLYFILDRYFYYLLFYSMFLPLDERWSLTNKLKGSYSQTGILVSPATIGIKLLVLWIYIDAGTHSF
jgi:hypothetical protein